MVKITWFHPNDPVRVTAMRYGSKSAELFLHMSEKDITRLSKLGKSKQVKAGRGLAFRWTGPFKILSKGRPKKKASTKPKPAPPIPRGRAKTTTRPKPKKKDKKKRKSSGKLSAYNLFVKKHRLAGKSMKQIGAMWRKKKR